MSISSVTSKTSFMAMVSDLAKSPPPWKLFCWLRCDGVGTAAPFWFLRASHSPVRVRVMLSGLYWKARIWGPVAVPGLLGELGWLPGSTISAPFCSA